MKTTRLIKGAILLFALTGALAQTGCDSTKGDDHDAMNDHSDMKDRNDDMRDKKEDRMKQAMATLEGTQSDIQVSGSVRFEQDDEEVDMTIEVNIPSKADQTVAVHIHEHGMCGNNGEAAGAHWNPTGEQHGKWGGGGFHSGDIGNIKLDKDGKGKMEIETDRWSIGGDARTDILNKAVIVHSGADDFTTQPSGNAGTRIGCGVIKSAGS